MRYGGRWGFISKRATPQQEVAGNLCKIWVDFCASRFVCPIVVDLVWRVVHGPAALGRSSE